MAGQRQRKIRVFQVATGNLGTEMIRRIAGHPDLELVGLHCYSPEKIGRDAGEIVGIPDIGVIATGSVDEIITAAPDVMTFHGVFPDEQLYERVLEAGINVVTTADWITGHHRDLNHPHPSGKPTTVVLEEACLRGGSTFHGTGMNPGLCQILGVVHSCDVAEIENVTVIESTRADCHHSVESWQMVGYGRPIDDPEIPKLLEIGTRVFGDGVYMMADCFGLELDEVAFSYDLGASVEDIDLGWYQLPVGSLAASRVKYQGIVNGVSRVEVHAEWQMTDHTDPPWEVEGCYITRIKADPCISSKHKILPKPGFDFSSEEAFASVAMTVTGLPALNAISAVVDAPPGLLTPADLPLRGLAGRFKQDI
jgi:4-hydroxy-tetrahydrodipicolinate reductase